MNYMKKYEEIEWLKNLFKDGRPLKQEPKPKPAQFSTTYRTPRSFGNTQTNIQKVTFDTSFILKLNDVETVSTINNNNRNFSIKLTDEYSKSKITGTIIEPILENININFLINKNNKVTSFIINIKTKTPITNQYPIHKENGYYLISPPNSISISDNDISYRMDTHGIDISESLNGFIKAFTNVIKNVIPDAIKRVCDYIRSASEKLKKYSEYGKTRNQLLDTFKNNIEFIEDCFVDLEEMSSNHTKKVERDNILLTYNINGIKRKDNKFIHTKELFDVIQIINTAKIRIERKFKCEVKFEFSKNSVIIHIFLLLPKEGKEFDEKEWHNGDRHAYNYQYEDDGEEGEGDSDFHNHDYDDYDYDEEEDEEY